MSGLDRHGGNAEQGPETGPRPAFSGAGAGRQASGPPQTAQGTPQGNQQGAQQGTPLSAPPAQQAAPPPRGVLSSGPNAVPMTLHGSSGDLGAPVEGRITIGDAVIGKIAAFAALEVGGVAALAARDEAPGTGVRVLQNDDEVTVDVAIAVDYGVVIKDVAKVVKANVARVAGMMLGARVAAVNVSVEDVRMPPAEDGAARKGGSPGRQVPGRA